MTRYAPAHAEVAHERVDDEVIVINLRTGAYFSLVGAAADAWTLLVAGRTTGAVAAALAERHGVEADRVAADLEPFLRSLVDEDLLRPIEGDAGGAGDAVLPPAVPGAAYRAPTLDKYDDMEELLLLDPIHEVDETGWPVVAAEPVDD